MNNSPFSQDVIERQLSEQTEWNGPDTQLWRQALESHAATTSPARSWNLSRRISRGGLIAAAACVLLFVGLVAIMIPAVGSARSSFRVAAPAASQLGADAMGTEAAAVMQRRQVSPGAPGPVHAASPAASAPSPRHVVRKASVELRCTDPAAAFSKVRLLVNDAAGEYIDDAQSGGDGPNASAQLTLRIAANRVGEVIAQLADIGKIAAQNSTGQDVTDQVVDLEARLRNEQRVESELLDMLGKNKDGRVEDLLKIRQNLATVRESIERMQAEREKMNRLTTLATLLVIIRAESAPPPAAAPWWNSTKTTLGDSWKQGIRNFSESLAWLIEVLVGGALWWGILGGIVFAAVRVRRLVRAAAAAESAPRLQV